MTKTKVDRQIREQLFDPHKKLSYKQFVKKHSSGEWRLPCGKLNIPKIKKHWEDYKKGRAYDPASRKKKQKHGINRPPKRWFYAMLKGIQKRSDVRDAAAVVGGIWKRLSPAKRAEIKRRELKGERFVYDLPLPVDYSTKGTGTLRTVKPFKLAEVQVNVSSRDWIDALKSKLFTKMKRNDGSTALVKRCKSDRGNVNIFVDKYQT